VVSSPRTPDASSGLSSRVPALPDGMPQLVDARPLGGGDVGEVWRGTLADGREVVIKRGPGDAELEAEGLEALRTAGASTPAVLGHVDDVIVLEHVAEPGAPERLGRELATVHGTTGPAFGWHRDNLIGPLPQSNRWTEAWPTFLAEQRLLPHVDALPAELSRRLRAAVEDGRLTAVADHDVDPSLVHGDLWAGNVLADRWLIDPAVHHADAEVDLAMLDLFGSVSPAMRRGYESVRPLDEGWERRRPLLQLPPLLVHVRLFGAGYLGGVASRLDALDW
jgi:fructosamine-3-kinase